MQQQLELIQEGNDKDQALKELDPKTTNQIVALMMQVFCRHIGDNISLICLAISVLLS